METAAASEMSSLSKTMSVFSIQGVLAPVLSSSSSSSMLGGFITHNTIELLLLLSFMAFTTISTAGQEKQT